MSILQWKPQHDAEHVSNKRIKVNMINNALRHQETCGPLPQYCLCSP